MSFSDKTGHVLVIDDDPGVLVAARLALLPRVEAVETLDRPDGVDDRLLGPPVDAILLDMNFAPGTHSGQDGLAWLDRLHRLDPTLSIVMMTAYGGVSLAVEALKRGAVDFVLKPWHNEKLIATMAAAIALTRARRDTAQAQLRHMETAIHPGRMIGTSEPMQQVFKLMQRVAATDANIFISGENGTGKGQAAREIHRLSHRNGMPFVAVDLGAIPEGQFESELFGHLRGAVPGTTGDRAGRFQAADGGTLFVDEIGNLPLHLQARLFTAVERREVWPVGARKPVPVDIRLITASRSPAADLTRQEIVREDLLTLLKTVEIHLPPLSERRGDIGLLLDHFLGLYARKHNVARRRLAPGILRRLEAYKWPGNIRELRHASERATLLAGNERLELEDFPFIFSPSKTMAEEDDFDLDLLEKRTIGRALLHFRGNISLAASALGLTRPALYRRMEKHGF